MSKTIRRSEPSRYRKLFGCWSGSLTKSRVWLRGLLICGQGVDCERCKRHLCKPTDPGSKNNISSRGVLSFDDKVSAPILISGFPKHCKCVLSHVRAKRFVPWWKDDNLLLCFGSVKSILWKFNSVDKRKIFKRGSRKFNSGYNRLCLIAAGPGACSRHSPDSTWEVTSFSK